MAQQVIIMHSSRYSVYEHCLCFLFVLIVETAHKVVAVQVTVGVEVEGQDPEQQVKVMTPSLNLTTTGHLVDLGVTLVKKKKNHVCICGSVCLPSLFAFVCVIWIVFVLDGMILYL